MPLQDPASSLGRTALTSVSLVLLLASFLLCPVSSEALHVATVSSGDWHALLRVSALAEAAQLCNHTVVVLVDSKGYKACGEILSLPACEPLPCGRTGCDAYAGTPLPRLLLGALQQRRFRADVFLADAFFDEVDHAAKVLDVPMLVLAGAAHELDAAQYAVVPKWRADASQTSAFAAAVTSAVPGFARSLGDLTGSRLPSNARSTSHTIVESIPGIDLSIPLCPNIHSVGILNTQGDPLALRVSETVDLWVRGCGQRLLYASSLHVGTLPPHSIHRFLRALASSTDACVLWHTSTSDAAVTPPRTHLEDSRVKASTDVLASPFHALRRYTPLAVLTSDPQSLLHDAILAQTPILYVGNSSGRCSLLRDAGVGACTTSFVASNVTSAVEAVCADNAALERLRSARRLAYLMGGAQKAIEIAELASALGRANTDFVCSRNLIYSPYGYDAVLALCASFVLSGVFVALFSLCTLMRSLVKRSVARFT